MFIASGYKSAALVSKLREVIYKEQPEDDTVAPAKVSRLLGRLLGLYEDESTQQGALSSIQKLAWLQADVLVEELRKITAQGSTDTRRTVQALALALVAESSKQLGATNQVMHSKPV